MAELDRAIHEKTNEFSVALDGRVKPGHDNGGRRRFFHTLESGYPWGQETKISHVFAVGPRFRGNDAAGQSVRSVTGLLPLPRATAVS
jgi:hypothetical protein